MASLGTSPLVRLQVALSLQAGTTLLGFTLPMLHAGSWLPLELGTTAGALVLAWFAGTGTRSAWAMTLAFEVLALTVGVTGAAKDHDIPGTVVGLLVLVTLVLPLGRRMFLTPTVSPAASVARLVPPAVVAARPHPPSAPPAFPPAGVLISTSMPTPVPPMLPPPPAFPPSR